MRRALQFTAIQYKYKKQRSMSRLCVMIMAGKSSCIYSISGRQTIVRYKLKNSITQKKNLARDTKIAPSSN